MPKEMLLYSGQSPDFTNDQTKIKPDLNTSHSYEMCVHFCGVFMPYII